MGIWVDGYSDCVKAKLENILDDNVKITNYAADGFTTKNVLKGAYPMLSFNRRVPVDPYPTKFNDKFHPLDEVEKLHKTSPVSHIVLSVGGNDIRVVLHSPEKILSSMSEFTQNYQQILERLLKITPNVIIMMQYRPSLYQDAVYGIYGQLQRSPMGVGDGMQKMNQLFSLLYPSVLEAARKYSLPLIDLSNTFEPRFSKLFCSQIEPSAYGSSLIAQLIAHTFTKHQWPSTQSCFYSCCSYQPQSGDNVLLDKIESVVNENNWSIRSQADLSPEQLALWADDKESNDDSDEEEQSLADKFQYQLAQLQEMGYTDKDLCLALLDQTKGDVVHVIDLLSYQ